MVASIPRLLHVLNLFGNAILICYCHFTIIEIIRFSNDIFSFDPSGHGTPIVFRAVGNADVTIKAAERRSDKK
jgi:hypothetical protein